MDGQNEKLGFWDTLTVIDHEILPFEKEGQLVMTSNAQPPKVRTGQGEVKISREEFTRRLSERFSDPGFQTIETEIDQVAETRPK